MKTSLLAMCLWLSTPSAAATPPDPMDLLYGDAIALTASGEPIITVGITSGVDEVALTTLAPTRLEFSDGSVAKNLILPAQTEIRIALTQSKPGKRTYYLDVGGAHYGNDSAIQKLQMHWQSRGYPQLVSYQEGVVIDLGGRKIDNRDLRVGIPVESSAAASQLSQEILQRMHQRVTMRTRLSQRPSGVLQITTPNESINGAIDYVHLLPTADAAIEVHSVEYAKGYDWHGQEHRRYRGELYIVVNPDSKLAVVNAVSAETLLAGVVPSEIFASGHREALKSQAIAARNILFSKLGRRHHDDPFHLCSEQHCQVYTGISKEDPRTTAAVRETLGLTLFYQNELVDAVYSANCGGHTEDNDAAWGERADPALRGRSDLIATTAEAEKLFLSGITETNISSWVQSTPKSYCGIAKATRAEKFRWHKHTTGNDISANLRKLHHDVGRIKDIIPVKRGSGGRLISIKFVGDKGSGVVVNELPIRQVFGNLNSAAIELDIHKDNSGFVTDVDFIGAGWGHGVGLCQLGAMGRAEAGQSFTEILQHYYNGATLERLYGDADTATVSNTQK